jgi:hypothetical protein
VRLRGPLLRLGPPICYSRCKGAPGRGSLWVLRCAELHAQALSVLLWPESEGSCLWQGLGSLRARQEQEWPSPHKARGRAQRSALEWGLPGLREEAVVKGGPFDWRAVPSNTFDGLSLLHLSGPAHMACLNVTITCVLPTVGSDFTAHRYCHTEPELV